jgi:hypothetical protein
MAMDRTELDEFDIEDMTDVAEQVVRKYLRTYRWADQDDLMQQAWDTMLKARTTWDASVGVALNGYLQRAVHHALRAFIWKDISPAHVPLRHAGHKVFEHTRSNPDTLQEDIECKRHPATQAHQPTPVEQLVKDEWHTSILDEMLSTFENDKEGHLARPVLMGEKRPAEVAKTNGVAVKVVYQATRRVKHALSNNYTLYQLWRSKA